MATTGRRTTREAAETRSRRSDLRLVWDLFWPRPPEPADGHLDAQRIRESVSAVTDGKEVELLLEEARSIYETHDARLARVESRATTLQATVGIATTLTLAAAGVVLDSNKVAGDWRKALATVIALLILTLVMTGWQATRATLKRFERGRVRRRDVLERLTETTGRCAHQKGRAIDLLIAAGQNAEIDRHRSAILLAARRWYYIALGLILVLAVLLGMYAWFGDVPASSSTA